MASGDIKNAYATKATITCTLTSLANGSSRESTAIDNTTNLFKDAMVRIKTNGQASGTGVLRVFVYAALGDTDYSDLATGSDASFTAGLRNSAFLGAVQMNSATGVVAGPFSVAAAFGGILPSKWGLIVLNNSGAALSATAGHHVLEYEGVFENVSP